MMAHQALQRTSMAQAQRVALQGSNCQNNRVVDNTELPSEERIRSKRRAQKENAKLRFGGGGGGGEEGGGGDESD